MVPLIEPLMDLEHGRLNLLGFIESSEGCQHFSAIAGGGGRSFVVTEPPKELFDLVKDLQRGGVVLLELRDDAEIIERRSAHALITGLSGALDRFLHQEAT